MGTLTDLGNNDILANNLVLGVTTAGGALTSGQMLPKYEYINVQLTSSSTSLTAFVNTNDGSTYKIAGASAVFGTASSSGTVQIEVATGTQATGSGTNQLTGTMSLAGTANTTVNGTVIASPTTITSGSRVNVIIGGTMTSLANCQVTILIQRIS